MYASKYGNISVVRFLIEQKANANWTGPVDGWTPLLLACSEKHTNIAEILLDKGADAAVIVKQQYERVTNFSPLIFACMHSDTKMAEMLIKKGANVNYYAINGYTFSEAFFPLNEACSRGNIDLVRLLINNGANVNFDNGAPLRLTLEKKGTEQIALLLIQNGANPNVRTNMGNLLLAAVENNYLQLAELALDKGIDINQRNGSNYTPLMRACMNGYLDMVKLLFGRGANPNLKDWYDVTALGHARRTNRPSIVLWLTSQGVKE